MFYVYVLFSQKDKKLYIGQTNDLTGRLGLHNAGKVKATKNRIPLKLVGCKTYETRNEARWVEYNLKHHSDKKKKFLKELCLEQKEVKP